MTYPATGYTVVVDGVTEIVAAHINQLENKVGYDNDTSPTTLDYRVKYLETYAALLPGRAGGQIINGGTGASEELTLKSTSNATKGLINLSENIGVVQLSNLEVDTVDEVAFNLAYTINKPTSGNVIGLKVVPGIISASAGNNYTIFSSPGADNEGGFNPPYYYNIYAVGSVAPNCFEGPIFLGQGLEGPLSGVDIEALGNNVFTGSDAGFLYVAPSIGGNGGVWNLASFVLSGGDGLFNTGDLVDVIRVRNDSAGMVKRPTGVHVAGLYGKSIARGIWVQNIDTADNNSSVIGVHVHGLISNAFSLGKAYGIKIGEVATPVIGVSESYGLHVSNVTSSGVAYNIYSAGATSRNYFEGSVGIGTTSPTEKLNIVGAASNIMLGTYSFFGSTDSSQFSILGFNAKASISNNDPIVANTGGAGYSSIRLANGSTGISFFTYNGSVTAGNNASNEIATITSTGVGIGTTSPGVALDVVGAGRFSTNLTVNGTNQGQGKVEIYAVKVDPTGYAYGVITVYDTSAQAAEVGGAINFGGKYLNDGTYSLGSSVQGYKLNSVSGDNSFGLKFNTYKSAIGGATRMTIEPISGNVGIGTTAPAKKLHVYGNGIYTQIDSGGVGDGGSIYFGSTSGSIPIAQIKSKAFSAGFGYLSFYTNISGSPYTSTERMTIDWEGKVGIGTIGPNKKLEVTDTASAQLRLAYNGSNYADFTVNSSGSLTIAPSNPASVNITGKLDVSAKVKVGTLLYFAAETDNGNGGASKTIDWTVNNHQKITLNSATCTLTFTAPSGPSVVYLKVVQDGTGGRLITWPTIKWGGATPPTLTTAINAIDLICFYYDGTLYNGMYTLNFA